MAALKKLLGAQHPDYRDMGSSSKPAVKEKALMHASNKKIFIGPAFQASVDAILEGPERDYYDAHTPSHEILLWRPTDRIPSDQLSALLKTLKPKGFDEDQVLAFLNYQFIKKGNPTEAIDATLHALTGIFVGKQEGMPLHDKVLFNQGYGFHGKNFDRIRDLVPSHSIQSLVNHYYTEFKRGKQVKVTGVRPETDIRKLNNAAALAMVPEALSHYHGDDSVPGRKRALEYGEEDSREVPNMGAVAKSICKEDFSIARRGIAALDPLTIANDDPSGSAVKNEQTAIDAIIAQKPEAVEKFLNIQTDLLPDLDADYEEAIALAREDAQKDPTPVWQQEEIVIFMRSLVEFGMDFAKSSLLLPSKTEQQVRNMYYNRAFFYGLDKLVRVHTDREAAKAAQEAEAVAKAAAKAAKEAEEVAAKAAKEAEEAAAKAAKEAEEVSAKAAKEAEEVSAEAAKVAELS
ncbi:hypothetical protein BV898_04840 [Hypsibius exemplaris]|uniref:ELM2 domain-containing protein n=1 Tax=Hypsibius exemplaris TaxID=2072580 RepID=A0A1W0X0W0_HYPEX|nr:hypothetical protein BV898_04840 [Hypsibius exemplaris]